MSAPSSSAFAAQQMSGAQPGTLSTLDHSGKGHGAQSQIEGIITALDAIHHTVTVGADVVTVTPSTVIRHGQTSMTFADLAVGDRVHVKATSAGGAVTADEIMVQNEGHGEDAEATVKGVVSALAGACPAITFTVNGTKVTTTASTIFRNTDCAGVVNGTNVRVKGTRQTDGSILASSVSLKLDKVEGTVSAVSGHCPALTLTVMATTVTTNASTTFRGGTCAQVVAGAEISVKGVKQPDASILATTVSIQSHEEDDQGESD